MKGQGGGGTVRCGGKSHKVGESVTITHTKQRQTSAINDNILTLRSALFTSNGSDKDITKDISPIFLQFNKNDLDISIEFTTKLSNKESNWAIDLIKENLEDIYDNSGYGWDDDDKLMELNENGKRFLLLKDNKNSKQLVGFVHFRFTVQGEVIDSMAGEPILFIGDIHLLPHIQRKGLGRHILTLLELIARREKTSRVSIPMFLSDDLSTSWIKKSKGYCIDTSYESIGFDSSIEGFQMYSKVFTTRPTVLQLPVSVVNSSASDSNNTLDDSLLETSTESIDISIDEIDKSTNELIDELSTIIISEDIDQSNRTKE